MSGTPLSVVGQKVPETGYCNSPGVALAVVVMVDRRCMYRYVYIYIYMYMDVGAEWRRLLNVCISHNSISA